MPLAASTTTDRASFVEAGTDYGVMIRIVITGTIFFPAHLLHSQQGLEPGLTGSINGAYGGEEDYESSE